MISIQVIEYEDGSFGTGSSNHKIRGIYKRNDVLKNYFTLEHRYLKVNMNQSLIADILNRLHSLSLHSLAVLCS